MEQQQFREIQDREKENLLREIASKTGVSITEARATQQSPQPNTPQFQSPQPSPQPSPQQNTPQFQSPQQYTTQFQFQSPQRLPPQNSTQFPSPQLLPRQFGQCLFGTGFGQQMQIYEIAASDRAGSGFEVANREYDELLRERYDAAIVSSNNSYEREEVREEDAEIMH